MYTPKQLRMARWRFTSAIGSCALFMKGLGGLNPNIYNTPEINAQAERALVEVEKLAYMLKHRFDKNSEP